MAQQAYDESYGGNAAENYQRYFVPSIGRPVAGDLMEAARLMPGERVLDVACGTGVATRLAAERVGETGRVVGLDVNPGMLEVARSKTPSKLAIDWCCATAESMPLDDESFDVALCQMGLQFIPNKLAALREMRRVLTDGGRVCITVPGPKPPLFGIMVDALERHLGADAASFGDLVFSMHDADELNELMTSVGLRDVDITTQIKSLRLPPPKQFLWEYIYSTPVAEPAMQASGETRDALEREVCSQWRRFVAGDGLALEIRMTTCRAMR